VIKPVITLWSRFALERTGKQGRKGLRLNLLALEG
jgi:hypothetical protein